MINYTKFLETIESIREGSANAFQGHAEANLMGLLMNRPNFASLMGGAFTWAGTKEGYEYWSVIKISLMRFENDATRASSGTLYEDVVF